MADIHDSNELRAARRRLYDRNTGATDITPRGLSREEIRVSHAWSLPVQPTNAQADRATSPTFTPQIPTTTTVAPTRRYRTVILIMSLLVFVFGVGLSSVYLYLGGNQISSEHIDIDLSGPFTVGGGEVFDLQVSLSNQNAVPIESATLIVKYPPGTRSVSDVPQTLFEERIPIRDIAPNEFRNVPLRVVVFGESGLEQAIDATIEYRIAGSSNTFYKEAEPLAFSISSSPLLVRLESVEKVAAGQLVNITMTLVSNSSTPLRDVLVEASYPNGFRFQAADPAPDFSNNVWQVSELAPQETREIVITGQAVGLTQETFRITVDAGQASPDNAFLMSSPLLETGLDFFIERPFIDVVTRVNGRQNDVHVLQQGASSQVSISVTNTLSETVYDLYVEAIPQGSVIDEDAVRASGGLYNPRTGAVEWRPANNRSFAAVRPGENRSLSFGISPIAAQSTTGYDLAVNVYARRVSEQNAAEDLIGTAVTSIKFSSEVSAGSQAARTSVDTGPLPPVAGQETTYTLTLAAEAGVNDITDAVISTSLPAYVNWRDIVTGDGEIVFNPIANTLTWEAGSISAGDRAEVSFGVSLTPTRSQAGSTLLLMNQAVLTATDRFTNQRLQSFTQPVYTELSTEAGFARGNGVVALPE